MLSAVMTLTVLMLLAFGLYSAFNVKSQLTPIISVAILVDITVICGMFNLLKPGVVVAYAVAIAIFALGVYRNKEDLKAKVNDFLSPGVILFLIASIAMLAFMSIRQPLMAEWDEFSFWGISGKIIKSHDQLYTFYKTSMIGSSTPPGLPVLTYIFQWANPGFAEWLSFFAYDTMFFAAFSAFTGMFGRKNWNSAVMVYLYGFLVPFIFEVYTRIIYLEPVYMSTYADIPLGLIFSAAMAVYLFSEKKDERSVLPVIPVMAFLVFTKDMGFALSCIICFIVFADLIASGKDYTFFKIKGFFAKIATGAFMGIVTLCSFFGWSYHMGLVMRRDMFNVGGAENMTMAQIVIVGLKELLIGPQREKFTFIQGRMTRAFFNMKISLLGTGVIIVGIITLLFIIAFITSEKQGRKRIVMMYITNAISFAAYYIFHLFLYVYVFKGEERTNLASYNRYIYAYYMGWLSMAVFLLCLSATYGKKFISKTVIFCFSGILLVLFNIYVDYQHIFLGVSETNFATRRNIRLKTEYLQDVIEEDDVIFVFSGDIDGGRWFVYTHELVDNILVEDRGAPVNDQMSEEEKREIYRNTFYQRFKETGVTHVLVDASSQFLIDTFGDLFDVPMDYVGINSVAYYKVNYENDFFSFSEVKGGIIG